MTEPESFNDEPISHPEDDKFGIAPFAEALADSITKIKSPVGTTIAINGAWGSGKSSAINLVRFHLKRKRKNGTPEIIVFKCWWFRGEEALTLAFLQELNASLRIEGSKAKEALLKITRRLLQARQIIEPVINIATGGASGPVVSGIEKSLSEKESVEKLFEDLTAALRKQKKRFLVVIDDIDRLAPDEALLMFKLVKSVGRLPNVIYLLAFDRELAEKAVKERYPSEGPHFLEKIIQASFDLPLPPRDDLNEAALSRIRTICGVSDDDAQDIHFKEVFNAISPYLNTPRDLVRLSNAMTVSWPPVAGEVDIADYMGLEIIRLFEPKLYNIVRMSKGSLCENKFGLDDYESLRREIQPFLVPVSDEHKKHAESILMIIFSPFSSRGSLFPPKRRNKLKRWIYKEDYFDRYFRMSISNTAISNAELDEFIGQCNNKDYVKKIFRNALKEIRKNGKSRVPLWLEELKVHASKINKDRIPNLVSAIFEIADDIDWNGDRGEGGPSFGDNYPRIYGFVYGLTRGRYSLDKRSNIFIAACKDAQVGWLSYFTRSIMDNYGLLDGLEKIPPEECLLTEGHVNNLKALANRAIEKAGANGELISHPHLAYILYRWREFSQDGNAPVKAWTQSQLDNDEAVALMAKVFRSLLPFRSVTHGAVERGNIWEQRMKNPENGLESVIHLDPFLERLETLENGDVLESPYDGYVKDFLQTWRENITETGDN